MDNLDMLADWVDYDGPSDDHVLSEAEKLAYITEDGKTCRKCGAKLNRSKRGKLYCSKICWEK